MPTDPAQLTPDPPHRRGRRLNPRPLPDLSQIPPPDPPPPLPPPPPDPAPDPDPPDTGPAASDILEYRRLVQEALRRQTEALRLYEPLPVQDQFHACRSHIRLLRGSNRSGKTLSAAVELARAVTGRDPHEKYPARDGRAYVVGKDEKHLGEVVYRKLFRPGAFKMIRDEHTGLWRLFRPWLLGDIIRKKEAKPAPPLIPGRYVQKWAWKSKAANVPEKVVLTTGWEIDFWSSLQKPPRGSDLDLVWLDEEIVDSEWVPEMLARLLDRAGCLFWGATPQTGSDRLYDLHQRCEAEMEEYERGGRKPEDEPTAREFVVLLADNPHIDDVSKQELAKGLSDAEADVRIGGNFAVEASKVYPEFNPRVHALPYFDIPYDWTRYAVIDPGRQVCAVLFGAVPPPNVEVTLGELPDGQPLVLRIGEEPWLFLYDELYIRNCDAAKFGEAMKNKCVGQEFEAFLIDSHGGRLADIGSGLTVIDQYAAALAAHHVRSNATGSNFIFGSDDVRGRTEATRALLRVRPCGWPTLLTVALSDRLPNFKHEIERYRYKRDKSGATDTPEDRGRVHLMACVSYLAAYSPKYVATRRQKWKPAGAFEVFRKRRAKRAKRDGGTGVNLGPSGGRAG